MKRPDLYLILILGVSLAGCSLFSPQTSATPEILSSPPVPVNSANADVLFVRAIEKDTFTWTFHVTVSHPDTGWEDYADGWDIVLPDGSVVLPDTSSPYTRLLTHPHETEQPFTRSQSGIVLPPEVKMVLVRAHDLVDGFGGKVVKVYLDQANGLNFEIERLADSNPSASLHFTQPGLDGNHYQIGKINLPASQPIDLPLAGVPVWVVGLADQAGSTIWVAALADGSLQAFRISGGQGQALELPTNQLARGMPPAVAWDGEISILNDTAANLAEFSHPILTSDGRLAFLTRQGQLVIEGSAKIEVTNLPALKDGRILSDGSGRLLYLASPSNVYQHGILGDAEEAKSVVLIRETGELLERITLYSDQVIEGLFPIWVDMDGDGLREIILTVSDRRNGAQLVVYSESGDLMAQGTPIGTGYRWRHQIAVAPFGPNREIELVDVLTPHIGGVVEFFRLEGDALVKVAEVPGYTSHVINSRNLDMAAAGDFNADGRVDLLLPSQDLTRLAIIQRNEIGAEVIGELQLDSQLSSNLAVISLSDGSLAVAAGLKSGLLRVWLP